MLFKVLALLILMMFYSCYIGKMILQKKAGIQTDQMGKGKTGFTKWVEIIMKCATYLVVGAEVLSIFFGTTSLPTIVRMIGFAFALIGVGFFVITVYTMKDSWRAGVSHTDDTELVTDGVFQISRNPAFLGFDLVYLGILCMFFNWGLLLASIFAALMLHLQIVNNEEPFLVDTFGQAYLDYAKKVKRYIGQRKS